MNNYREWGSMPSAYLKTGEKLVNEKESLLTAAADTYFGELIATPTPPRTISDYFIQQPNGCVVVLDGCSLRELPRLIELAEASNRSVMECTCGRSAVPSATEYFISDRLGWELPLLGPSQLLSRRELRERGVRYHFFKGPNEFQRIEEEAGPILIWHRFPDLRFLDSTAASASLYDGIWDTLELVWQRTVQAMPPDRPVLVTSDHGYAFLGTGLSDMNLVYMDRDLRGKRFRKFEDDEPLPKESPALYIDHERRMAVLKGRCHNRPKAPSPSQSIYRHGGLSLMEVLTPWLALGPME